MADSAQPSSNMTSNTQADGRRRCRECRQRRPRSELIEDTSRGIPHLLCAPCRARLQQRSAAHSPLLRQTGQQRADSQYPLGPLCACCRHPLHRVDDETLCLSCYTSHQEAEATIWSHVRRYVSWFNRSIDAASRGQEEPTDELPMVPCDECAMLFAVTEFITPSGQHVLQCPYCRNRQLRRYYDERLN